MDDTCHVRVVKHVVDGNCAVGTVWPAGSLRLSHIVVSRALRLCTYVYQEYFCRFIYENVFAYV